MKESTVFFHMNQLGDLMFSLPLIAAMRKQWPNRTLVSVARPALCPLIRATGFVDDVIVRPKAGWKENLRMVHTLREWHFTSAVLFSESPESLMIAAAARIPERIGFDTASLSFLLTKKTGRSGVPSLANNRNLAIRADLMNIHEDYAGLVKVPYPELKKTLAWLAGHAIQEGRFVAIAPGASKRRTEKFWENSRWAALIRKLHSQGVAAVLAGSPAEAAILETIADQAGVGTPVFAPEGGITELAALLKLARLFVGIDSGAMHLAAALTTPVVGLFGPTDPEQIGPRPAIAHTVVRRSSMADINVEDVWTEVSVRLSAAR